MQNGLQLISANDPCVVQGVFQGNHILHNAERMFEGEILGSGALILHITANNLLSTLHISMSGVLHAVKWYIV